MKLKSESFKSLALKLQTEFDSYKKDSRERKHQAKITPISDEAFKALKTDLEKGELVLPDDAIQSVVRATLERDFLNVSTDGLSFTPGDPIKEQGWIRICRLPISPLEEKQYAMFPRWQNAIATMHTLRHRLCYVLLRWDGETQLFLGAIPMIPGDKGKVAGGQLAQILTSQMPGIGLETKVAAPMMGLGNLGCCGAVTGIPSVRKITEYGEYQTMDQIAMGLRDEGGNEQNFAVVILADPVPDAQIVDILQTMENLGSEIHALTQYTKTDSTNSGETVSLAFSDGTNKGINGGVSYGGKVSFGMEKLIEAECRGDISVGGSLGWFSSTSSVRGANVGKSDSVAVQYIKKSAMYCEELFDKHIERLKAGRNLGFWKTGVYVLSDSESNVKTIMGTLRAMYSGDETHIEPIRTAVMPANCGASQVVERCQYLPYRYPTVAEMFGSIFEDYATPMTTEELSIATSLPRRDVPGLRLIRVSSRFATNPPPIQENDAGGKPVSLGEVLDTGVRTYQTYRLDLNQLVRHTLVAGSNGSGKSHTCKYLLDQVQQEKIPFLVIEPAKDEYLEWAIRQNKLREQSGRQKIRIFAPGYFGDLGITENQESEILNLWKEYTDLTDRRKKLVPGYALHRLNALLEELEKLTGKTQERAVRAKKNKISQNEITEDDRNAAQRFTQHVCCVGDIEDLHLNLFQPTAANGSWINIMKHLDRIKSALISSMPMADVLPLIMIDTLYEHTMNKMDVSGNSMHGERNPLLDVYRDDGTVRYPLVDGKGKSDGMKETAAQIISDRNYADEVKNNLKAAMHTRINTLVLGWKRDLFNTERSTDLAQLFEGDAVINLSHLSDDADKALVMSILLIALWEYRESKYQCDREYKRKADRNELMHLTLIEEAHRLMPDVRENGYGAGSQQTLSKMFSNMLSEIRAYGEGCIVVDQVPTRLIPDAVKNTNLKIIHRLTASDDIHAVAASMRLRPDQQAVVGALQRGEAIVCSDYDDGAAWIQVDPAKKKKD